MGQQLRHGRRNDQHVDAGVVHVTENGTLTGMVTDRDISIRVAAAGKDPGPTKVAEVARTGDDTQTGVVKKISN